MTEFDFSGYNGYDVSYACSVQIGGDMFVFGGIRPNTKKVLKMENQVLNQVAELPFDLYLGTCTSFNGDEILLCFDHFDSQQ